MYTDHMMKSMTPDQARLIAGVLTTLEEMGPVRADGQYLRVNLMDEMFDDPIGTFTCEEGAWLYEPATEARVPTLSEVTEAIYAQNPNYYTDRKIAFIKDVRSEWDKITGMPSSLLDTKVACEKVLSINTIRRLREKLENPMPADPGLAEDRAWGEARERISETGTWFGAPGPMDEEPF